MTAGHLENVLTGLIDHISVTSKTCYSFDTEHRFNGNLNKNVLTRLTK